jgi:hypothetical protein
MEIEITATVLVVEVVEADSLDQAVHDFMDTHDGQLPDTVEGRHVLGVCGECTATIFDGDTYDFLQMLGTSGDPGNAVWTCEICAEAEAARAEERDELSPPLYSEVAAVPPGTDPVDIIETDVEDIVDIDEFVTPVYVKPGGRYLVNDATPEHITPGDNEDGFTLV